MLDMFTEHAPVSISHVCSFRVEDCMSFFGLT